MAPGTHHSSLFTSLNGQHLHQGSAGPAGAGQPLHVLAQQLMALALQLSGLGIRDWRRWIGRLPPFAALAEDEFERILAHLLKQRILFSDGVRLSLGDQAQADYGRRHFMELLSVFTTPPLMTAFHGRKELGQIDQVSLVRHTSGEPVVLSLGGRSWRVQTIEWRMRQVFVEPADTQGRSSWLGARRGVSYPIGRQVHRLLTSTEEDSAWSQRAREQIAALRDEYGFLRPDADVVTAEPGRADCAWYTLAGRGVNLVLSQALAHVGIETTDVDDFCLVSMPTGGTGVLEEAICGLDPNSLCDNFSPPTEFIEALKFAECLPTEVVTTMLSRRFISRPHLAETLGRGRQYLISAD